MQENLFDHLEKVKYFQAIAKWGSFHRASMVIGVSQSALSHSVKKLEDVLEQKLFNRSVKGVRLTPHGQRLLKLATTINNEIKDYENETKQAGKTQSLLKIGTYDTIANYLLPQVINRLKSQITSFEISIEKNGQHHLNQLIEDNIDLAVLAESYSNQEINSKKVFSDSYAFFIPNKGPLAKTKFSKESLLSSPLIYFPMAIAGKNLAIDRILENFSLNSTSIISVTSFETVKKMTACGLGIGLMPLRVAEDAINNHQIKKTNISGLPKHFARHGIYLHWKKQNDEKIKSLLRYFA